MTSGRSPLHSQRSPCGVGVLLASLVVIGLAAPAAAVEQRVRRIDFEGVEVVSAKELLGHMVSERPDRIRFWKKNPVFSRFALQEDLRRIERVYGYLGYYEAEVRSEVVVSPSGEKVDIVIHVEEGEPVRLTSISIEPAAGTTLPVADLDLDLPLRAGEVFAVSGYRDARNLVIGRLAEAAHPAASIQGGADVDVETRTARVHWVVDPGPFVRIGAVTINGLEDVGEKVVVREIGFVAGQPYSPAALDRTRRRLSALQLFRFISVEPNSAADVEGQGATADSEVVWPVVVDVTERAPRSISIGGGWASGLGPRGSARWSHRNFFGDARRADIGAGGSPLEQGANIRLLQPYVFGSRASLEADLGWVRRSRDSYDSNIATFTLGPRRNFGERWVGEAAYTFGWTGVNVRQAESDEAIRELQKAGLLSGFTLRARRIDVDTVVDPTRGTWLQLTVGTNLKALGSDFDWMYYGVEGRGYIPLGPTVIATRVRFRAIDPLRTTRAANVPLGARLFLGGPHDGRGFPFEELGPLNSAGDPIGGVTSLLASIEWRVPVWGPVELVGFVDAGQVSTRPFTVEADQFGVGVGAGITFDTPVGPVAGYAGYPVRNLAIEQKVRIAVTVGHSF